MSIKFEYNDGGRSAAGYIGNANDCVARAIAIATQQSYETVYKILASGMSTQRSSKYTKSRSKSARNGISVKRKWFKDYMHSLGWRYTPCMKIGSGCTVHLQSNELPAGRLIVQISKHYTAVIDGTVCDTHCQDRAGTRCVYGYWSKSS